MHLLTGKSDTGSKQTVLAAVVLALFRALVGVSFAIHGYSTLFGKPVPPRGPLPAIGAWPGWWAGAIELAAGTAVALGLGTRVAALLCSGSMAYAFLTVHLDHGILPIKNGGEPAVLFCWSFFLIAVLGPGPYSLDALLSRYGVLRRHPAPLRT
ncbi:DoxX family protein [Nocardia sp. NBC_01503]|uniref:DoxX family protein n=1 Tax=Nocardia sp. NBC_01503 TaxID=2975997 RepID=UPI002E7AC675|nr:DoxX family protein [Nocardia sp. NBC_01503]WTL29430.1 DoxX family protein [Nocardia sp. NBC_01503]